MLIFLLLAMNYCEFTAQIESEDNLHKHYHDCFYGFPIEDDNELFGRLILEINQAGLSWETILKKESNFRKAYNSYNIDIIAAYSQSDIDRLLSDSGIIRNKLKVNAAVYNAQQIQTIQKEYGSFKNWLDKNHPLTKEEWVKLFKKHFKFVGGEIVNEFLMSTGYFQGAHVESCPTYSEVLKHNPAWSLV